MKPPLPNDPSPRDTSGRLIDFKSLVTLVRSANTGGDQSLAAKRRLLADLCRLVGDQVHGPRPPALATAPIPPAPPVSPTLPPLPPRRRQVLDALLEGKSEKEVAKLLKLSVHTVHVHVKAIYKQFGVTTRAELLAACLGSKPSRQA